VFAIIAAYESIVASGMKPSVNLKFFFEGEEEAGSVYLEDIFTKYKERLKTDLWIICDGPRHISGRKQVLFGVRGDVNLDLTVYGAKRPLHSGNYGNWVIHDATATATGMKDKDGTTINGFYAIYSTDRVREKAISNIPMLKAR
jgi:acetylornithine deacetylase/succinyl-diaminopimelate desuccinylase-like protein